MRVVLGFLLAVFSCSLLAANPVTAIRDFTPEKYLGSWYEVARLPMFFERNCRVPIIAHYRADPKNDTAILVQNSCMKTDGKISIANGVAHFTKTPNVAELKVTFLPALFRWVPFTSGDYWVLYTDYTHYALVGDPSHKYLWILSRNEHTSREQVAKLVESAKAQGFATDELIFN